MMLFLLLLTLVLPEAHAQSASDCVRAIQALVPANTGITLQGTDCSTLAISGGTSPGLAAIQAWIAAHPVQNIIPFPVFIGRFTDAEYQLLLQAKAQVIAATGTTSMFLVKELDQAMSAGTVDLNTPAAQIFKANLVAASILTQARANVIFQ